MFSGSPILLIHFFGFEIARQELCINGHDAGHWSVSSPKFFLNNLTKKITKDVDMADVDRNIDECQIENELAG